MSGAVVWFTGLPRSGKSTLAEQARAALARRGRQVVVLDGDAVRGALSPRPGYDAASRDAFYATLGALATLLAQQGQVVLVPATAHRRVYRDAVRATAPRFIEVHVATPAGECAARPGGELYRGERSAQLPGAGVGYEPPTAPEVVARGGDDADALAAVVALAASDGPATSWRKILCPMDFSPPSVDSYKLALTLARAGGGEVTLLHVFHQPDDGAGFRRRVEDVHRELSSWTRAAVAAGVSTSVRASPGAPAAVICELARAEGYDVIVLGASGSSRMARLVFGSVAAAVLRAAPCAVVTVGLAR